jgi:hypothetical protein
MNMSHTATHCGYPDCAISTPTYALGHSYKETLMKKQRQTSSATRIGTTTSPRGDSAETTIAGVVHISFPLLIALDSLGGVTCTRLTLSSTPVSCSTKVVASHISGVSFLPSSPPPDLTQAPRTIALSPCGNFLALGSSSSLVQIFALKVKDTPDHRFAVSLSLLTRIVFPFPIDNIFFAPLAPPQPFPREPWAQPTRLPLSQYELLTSSRAGDIG